jgi:hypothetical protein
MYQGANKLEKLPYVMVYKDYQMSYGYTVDVWCNETLISYEGFIQPKVTVKFGEYEGGGGVK